MSERHWHFDLFAFAERSMGMSQRTWARHANPLSVYTRIIGGTPVFLALWSPFWIGWWGTAAIALAALWIWLNPRLFQPPMHTRDWGTRGVLGERVFLNRATVPIPREHATVAHIATGLSVTFIIATAAAFVLGHFWMAFTAWHAATVAKLWFCDRMVWLWQDMKDATDPYRAWDRAEWSRAHDAQPDG